MRRLYVHPVSASGPTTPNVLTPAFTVSMYTVAVARYCYILSVLTVGQRKKVTAVTFFQCPNVSMHTVGKYIVIIQAYFTGTGVIISMG